MILKKYINKALKAPFHCAFLAEIFFWISGYINLFFKEKWRLFQIAEECSNLNEYKRRKRAFYLLWTKLYKNISDDLIENSNNYINKKENTPLFFYFIDPSENKKALMHTLNSIYRQSYKKIKIIEVPKNEISKINLDTNNLVIDIEPGDTLAKHALLEIALYYINDDSWDIAYFDEDYNNKSLKDKIPFFKPDYSQIYLNSIDYMKGARVIRAKALPKINKDEMVSLKIHHIPEVLIHRYKSREIRSTSYNEIIKKYIKNKIKVKISIIIPTKNNKTYLEKCISSILNKTNYDDYEILIINNKSDELESITYLDKVIKERQIRVIEYPYEFNFSKINNFAVKESNGEYLVFLNNDTEVIEEDWLRKMSYWLDKPNIGCVGAKLLYEDKTIQHVGAILGMAMGACHYNVGVEQDDAGYFGLNTVPKEVTVVTAACMGIKKEVFLSSGGFDENIPIAFNDVELCVRLNDKGYENIIDPNILLFHHESRTRGYNDDENKILREKKERNYFIKKIEKDIRYDLRYNPNLSLRNSYCLSFPPRTISKINEIEYKNKRRILLLGSIKKYKESIANIMIEHAKIISSNGYDVLLGVDKYLFSYKSGSQILIGDSWSATDLIFKKYILYVISYSDPFNTIEWNLPSIVKVFHFKSKKLNKNKNNENMSDILDNEASETYGTAIRTLEEFLQILKAN